MFEATGRSFPIRAEQRLLLAVLENAVGTFERYLVACDARGRRLFTDVEAWFASEDTDWLFSFIPICDALGLDVPYLRAGLRRLKDEPRVALEMGPALYCSPFRRVVGMRHRTNGRAQGTLRDAQQRARKSP